MTSLRPHSTLAPTYTAQEMPYSLAGSRDVRKQSDRATYVEDGYRSLNPEYEKEAEDPKFSLGGNLPHTVRPFMVRKNRDGEQKAVGVKKDEKGETERAPQVENTDARANRTQQQRDNDSHEPFPQSEDHGTDGEAFRTDESDMTGPPSADTIVPEPEPSDQPFNSWAAFRKRYQDPLGEWLGTTVVVALGLSGNLSVATSQDQAGTYQSMLWTWGLATMLGIYISGGSSGAHLNPAVTIMLSVYVLGAFTGAVIAICIYRDTILYLDGALLPASTGIYIYTQPKDYVKPATAFFTEAFATGALSGSILALGDDANSPPGAGMHAFIIGLLVTTLIMALGSNTGGTLNPARDFGPRLAAMALGYPTSIFNAGNAWWIWGGWGATITGALLGAAVYDACIFKGGESPVNYNTRKWQIEGRRSEIGFFGMLGNKSRANDIEQKLERGEI
ncbi:hypothetical protein MBLNU459_g7097t1 [Dothideomycetes sp. NU459]